MINPAEIFDLALMIAIVGYIFMDYFKKPVEVCSSIPKFGFDWESFKFACLITAPAIVLHELAHKFVALALGLSATFHASYSWLGIGLLLRFFSNIIFFVPGYVSISPATPLQAVLTAAAGPLVNLLLFLAASLVLVYKKRLGYLTFALLTLTKKINLFLFALNMIPIGFFDGAKVLSGLMQLLF